MDEIITYRGEDIESLDKDKLVECIKFCKQDIDRREEAELKRLESLFK